MEESARKRFQVGALVAVCVVTWYVTLLVRGRTLPFDATVGEHFSGFTTAISVGAFAAIAFAKWIWRWQKLHPWLVETTFGGGIVEG